MLIDLSFNEISGSVYENIKMLDGYCYNKEDNGSKNFAVIFISFNFSRTGRVVECRLKTLKDLTGCSPVENLGRTGRYIGVI